ncbi:tripartite motif-containing protein 2-like isoform X2 [Homarus americanus]|uniref:tripartite motif-containing protein 2-like isoform X2 n=1 Tax=Homarus americanus TaxID=6706 RepID=UPI001C46DFA0|nr:tripartite motif-containing protein 2-like isoform X2 [Homarus americanus]
MAENNGDLGPLDCKVCWIRYNTDDRRPRILDCGHTFCTKCLVTSAGKKTLRCPSCRTSYKINSVSSVSININIEDFLESTGLLASPQSTAGICAEHPDYPLFFYCLQHQVWMCYMCKNLNHPDIDSCDVISYENYLLRLKKKGQNIFLNQIEHCNRISEVIERKTNEINYIIDGYNQQIQTLYARIYTLRQSIGVLVNEHSEMARVQHEGKLGCQELRKAHRDLNQTTNLVEMEQTMSNLLYWQQTTQEWMDFTKKCCNIPATLDESEEVLQKLIPWLLRCRGQIVAVDASSDQQEHEQTNYAEVSELEKKIHLHSLRNYAYQPSPSSIMLPYGKLLRLARDYGALAFLDFNWGSAHGRIYVRLKRNSAQGNQFLQFCTGYDGRTYVGTHLLQIFNKDNPGECIIVGENDPKQPLSASLTNIGYSSNGQYSRPWSPGLVWGGWGTCSTQFGITLRHWTGGLPAPSCFGWIESGLEILQSAVLHPNISQVKVVDCGVVIS